MSIPVVTLACTPEILKEQLTYALLEVKILLALLIRGWHLGKMGQKLGFITFWAPLPKSEG